MSSTLKNVAAFLPVPPLYFNEDDKDAAMNFPAIATTNMPIVFDRNDPSLDRPRSFESSVRNVVICQDDKMKTQQGNRPSFQDFPPGSPPTRKVSTLDPTSPSFVKQSTPPASPYPWKKMPHTPSSATTVSTAMMTPLSTASRSTTTYLSTPPLSSLSTSSTLSAKSKPYAVAVSMGTTVTPKFQHDQFQDSPAPYGVSVYQSSTPSTGAADTYGGYDLTPVSPTKKSSAAISPKKKSKLGLPSKRSPNKKKTSINGNSGLNVTAGSTPPEDTASRKQRVKTELCMHYMQSKACPFGDSCTYAHGEDELQTKTLADLQKNCLLDDVENYRTKPCFTFVAMGSCPFGRRCNAIHDPRVAGDLSSWLPLTETQGNNIATDINVEGLHQKRHYSIIAGNPFGEYFSIDLDGWNDLYKLVTNTSASQKRRKNTISEVHKLSIAIQMRGTHQWMFKYRPQHVIFQDTCMVLQRQTFRLENESGNAIPISMKFYKPGKADHVMVHELAFGPDSDPSVRGVALWFNIPEKEIAEVAPQQAKRFRWKKTSKFDDSKLGKPSVFDSRECFTMIRPTERDAFDLATEILEHRFKTVKAERLTSMEERFETLKKLKGQKQILEDIFQQQRRSWIAWGYPINNGRQRNDGDTPIPAVDDEYHPIIDHDLLQQQDDTASTCVQAVFGSEVEGIWQSFVTFIGHETTLGADSTNESTAKASNALSSFRGRLSIFVKLSRGEAVCPNRTLPHITRSFNVAKRDIGKLKTTQYTIQSERCWKSLLLKPKNYTEEPSEWHIVMDHFQNFSRSKKVLSIIQQ